MAVTRTPINQVGINVRLGSAGTTPEYKPGQIIPTAEGNVYIYGQANGAVAEGYGCKYVEGVFDFDPVTTAESGTTPTPIGINVTDGGLADNYWGWFWKGGSGQEYAYVTDIAADVQVTTGAGTAGQLTSGGDTIQNLFTNENNSTAGLTICRASGFFSTNFTIIQS